MSAAAAETAPTGLQNKSLRHTHKTPQQLLLLHRLSTTPTAGITTPTTIL